MSIKSTTIVVNVTKNVITDFSKEKFLNAACRCYCAQSGDEEMVKEIFASLGQDVLEEGENYIITKDDQKVTVIFYHDGEVQGDITEKITLTGMESYSMFGLEQYISGQEMISMGKRRANSAGILETLFPVPPCSLVVMRQK